MLRQLIYRLFRGRHYWRLASFDEIAELYASRLITVFAINIVNMFAAVYLYKLGYGIVSIAVLYGFWYILRVLFAPLAAKYAAYYGPKHGILVANIIRIPSLVAFAFVPVAGEYAFWAVMAFGVLQQISATFYNLCYMVDFSKVRHSDHAGKEIGTMLIVEKIAKIISPVAGGLVAAIYGPQVAIIAASLLFAIAALPLLRTVEPTKLRGKLGISGFPWQRAMPSIVTQTVVGYDFITSGLVWTLFITLFVFGGIGDAVYAALGGLASIGVLASIIASWTFGQIVDRHRGGILLALGTIANSVIHVARPLASSSLGVVGVNIANETSTSAYIMPLTRVVLDVADSSGFRITYIMFVEIMQCVGAVLACAVLALGVVTLGEEYGMIAAFLLAAIYELILLSMRRAAR